MMRTVNSGQDVCDTKTFLQRVRMGRERINQRNKDIVSGDVSSPKWKTTCSVGSAAKTRSRGFRPAHKETSRAVAADRNALGPCQNGFAKKGNTCRMLKRKQALTPLTPHEKANQQRRKRLRHLVSQKNRVLIPLKKQPEGADQHKRQTKTSFRQTATVAE